MTIVDLTIGRATTPTRNLLDAVIHSMIADNLCQQRGLVRVSNNEYAILGLQHPR